MENLLFLIATSFVLRMSAPRRLTSQAIGQTGCSLLFKNTGPFEKRKTDSGDDLYFNEFTEKGVTYGVICIQMQERFELAAAAEMLAAYMHKLKGPFYIFHNTGHQETRDWNHTESITLEDYWQNAVGVDCKVKGYTDGKVLAVLYVKNINEVDVTSQDQFLDSFHFASC